MAKEVTQAENVEKLLVSLREQFPEHNWQVGLNHVINADTTTVRISVVGKGFRTYWAEITNDKLLYSRALVLKQVDNYLQQEKNLLIVPGDDSWQLTLGAYIPLLREMCPVLQYVRMEIERFESQPILRLEFYLGDTECKLGSLELTPFIPSSILRHRQVRSWIKLRFGNSTLFVDSIHEVLAFFQTAPDEPITREQWKLDDLGEQHYPRFHVEATKVAFRAEHIPYLAHYLLYHGYGNFRDITVNVQRKAVWPTREVTPVHGLFDEVEQVRCIMGNEV